MTRGPGRRTPAPDPLDPGRRGAPRHARFWAAYIAADPATATDPSAGVAGSNRWRPVPGTGIVVSRCCAASSVGLFLRGRRGMAGEGRAALAAAAGALKARLGVAMDADPAWPFLQMRPTTADNLGDMASAITWLIDETARYAAAVAGCLTGEGW